jgi:hypothetical protein
MKKKRRGCNGNLYHGYATFHNEKQADSSIMQGKTPEQIMARFVVAMMEQEKKDVIIEPEMSRFEPLNGCDTISIANTCISYQYLKS